MSLQFASPQLNQQIIHRCVANGLITDWFIFATDRLRIAPPLCISEVALQESCEVIIKSIEQVLLENQ